MIISVFLLGNTVDVKADWWERPPARPTSPAVERDRLPTDVPPTIQPTTVQPSPTNPPSGGLPTSVPTTVPSGGGGGGTTEDSCAPGKSYNGPYCGWSPIVEGGTASVGESPRIGGPQVLGLSKTSGGDLELSDIIFLSGVLCLVLYVRSKLSPVNIQ